MMFNSLTFVKLTCALLFIGNNGHCKTIGTRKDELAPDCGEELCIPGYEMCLESRCRNCADFVNTEYGCENIRTLKECAAYCIEEIEKRNNITILSLVKKAHLTNNNCTSEHATAGGIVLYVVIGIIIGGTIGFLSGFQFNPCRCTKTEANGLTNQIKDQMDLTDSRFSQIPASNSISNESSQGLIAQESNDPH